MLYFPQFILKNQCNAHYLCYIVFFFQQICQNVAAIFKRNCVFSSKFQNEQFKTVSYTPGSNDLFEPMGIFEQRFFNILIMENGTFAYVPFSITLCIYYILNAFESLLNFCPKWEKRFHVLKLAYARGNG